MSLPSVKHNRDHKQRKDEHSRLNTYESLGNACTCMISLDRTQWRAGSWNGEDTSLPIYAFSDVMLIVIGGGSIYTAEIS